MQFIKHLGSRESTPGNPKTSRRFGLFLCPSCNEEVERSLSHGKRNKSCGNKECRKALLTPSANVRNLRKESPITINPQYSALRYFYNKILNETTAYTSLDHFLECNLVKYTRIKEANEGAKITYSIVEDEVVWKVMTSTTSTTRHYTPKEDYKAKATSLYLVQSSGYTKIGVTNDINNRLKAFRGSSPHEVTLHSIYDVYCPYTLEAFLHAKYSSKRVQGEWFTLEDEDITNIVKYITATVVDGVWAGDTIQEAPVTIECVNAYPTAMPKRTTSKYVDKPKITTDHSLVIEHDRTNQIEANTTHGLSGTRKYHLWQTVKKKSKEVGMLKAWENNPQLFIDYISKDYDRLDEVYQESGKRTDAPSLVLIDKEGSYVPSNIRIVTHKAASSTAKAVNQLSKEGDFIASYPSARSVDVIGAIPSKIGEVCNGKRKSHAGFLWEFAS